MKLRLTATTAIAQKLKLKVIFFFLCFVLFFQVVTWVFQNTETKQTKSRPETAVFCPWSDLPAVLFGLGEKRTERITIACIPLIKNWWLASIHGSDIKLNTADDVTWFLYHKRPSTSWGGVTVIYSTLHVSYTVSKSFVMTRTCWALKLAAMVTDVLPPARHVTLSIISACFYIMVFD